MNYVLQCERCGWGYKIAHVKCYGYTKKTKIFILNTDFFQDAQDSFTDWFDHYHQKKPTAPKKPPPGSGFAQQVAYEQAEQQFKAEMDRWKHSLDLITKVDKL